MLLRDSDDNGVGFLCITCPMHMRTCGFGLLLELCTVGLLAAIAVSAYEGSMALSEDLVVPLINTVLILGGPVCLLLGILGCYLLLLRGQLELLLQENI